MRNTYSCIDSMCVPKTFFLFSCFFCRSADRRGLLVSGMVDTARGAVLNLLDDVDRFG